MLKQKIAGIVFLLLLLGQFVFAGEYDYINYSDSIDDLKNRKLEKEKDPRVFEEKFRSVFHLPPTKKIYYHNIDKSNQPMFMDDYYEMATDKKRYEFEIPEPSFDAGEDIIMPDRQFRVIRYNTPPGQRNIDERKLVSEKVVVAPGILSPDKTKMVYTKSFFYSGYSQTSSAVYLIPVNAKETDAYQILYKTNVVQGDVKPLFTVGTDDLTRYQFKTLFPIDWSKDSTKIAFKEKIGSNVDGTWKTNVIIYDFKTKNWKKLTAVREAIVYWWRENKQIDLKDYMWDIFPMGWDKNNPDRLIVYAYAYTKNRPLFLGTWSIDYNEAKSSLISIDSTNAEIDLNGFGLKEILLEH